MTRHSRAPKSDLRALSIKVPAAESARLTLLARERGTTLSAVVRDALEQYPGLRDLSFAEAAKDFAGCLAGGPGDLATNPKHRDGMGVWRR
jgi:predicted DNA-binding protein